jgi:hypothetical protein
MVIAGIVSRAVVEAAVTGEVVVRGVMPGPLVEAAVTRQVVVGRVVICRVVVAAMVGVVLAVEPFDLTLVTAYVLPPGVGQVVHRRREPAGRGVPPLQGLRVKGEPSIGAGFHGLFLREGRRAPRPPALAV